MPMQDPALRTRKWRAALLCTAALAAIALFRAQFAMLLRLLLGAGALAFVLDPLCSLLAARMSRPHAALCALLLAAVGICVPGALLLPVLVRQCAEIAAALPAAVSGLNSLVSTMNEALRAHGFSGTPIDLIDPARLSGLFSGLWTGTARMFGSLAGALSSAALSCILAYYFLAKKEKMLLQAEMLVPCRWRCTAARMCCSMRDELRGYLRSQAIVALCIGVLSAAAFAVIGVRGALSLGLLVGIANSIPYFGPFLGGAPAVLCALTGGIAPAMLVLIALIVIQQIDNIFITPRVTGGATGLSPPAVMLSVLLGGSAFGWAGMLLAVPAVCTMRCIWRAMLCERLLPPS